MVVMMAGEWASERGATSNGMVAGRARRIVTTTRNCFQRLRADTSVALCCEAVGRRRSVRSLYTRKSIVCTLYEFGFSISARGVSFVSWKQI